MSEMLERDFWAKKDGMWHHYAVYKRRPDYMYVPGPSSEVSHVRPGELMFFLDGTMTDPFDAQKIWDDADEVSVPGYPHVEDGFREKRR